MGKGTIETKGFKHVFWGNSLKQKELVKVDPEGVSELSNQLSTLDEPVSKVNVFRFQTRMRPNRVAIPMKTFEPVGNCQTTKIY